MKVTSFDVYLILNRGANPVSSLGGGRIICQILLKVCDPTSLGGGGGGWGMNFELSKN